MSSDSEQEEEQQVETPPPDDDLIRVLVSTDNHLGYAERDPVRGLDSFAAFEEVLHLARKHKCDMVLIAGDLFHENKPSRRTLHKTMEIIRRYSMGPDPVQIQIVSDQATNFRSVYGTVNYEDEFYSVDLPIFSIHGNHDDPTREGGMDHLAALDLLAVSNLVNYFGRQDAIDKVEVSPILIEKGDTKLALYGMGSMRDERLNRMWRGKKVRFLRPNENQEDWFHIFALHQNRDLGRGTKNCVHESMIPEWMDLIVWGHEHECIIDPTESVVGTFRITQPGSSVATSLTGGEAVRKQVGLLEIKGNQFRMQPIPLTQVRSFVMGDFSLQEQGPTLDPEDPKVDVKVTKLLEREVQQLVFEAREKYKNLLRDAKESGRAANVDKLTYKLEKPNEVLVRLRVEHSGFTTLNNQRFGARFVGDLANPADVLLFHRKKQKDGSRTKKKTNLVTPIAPDEVEEMAVEDLVKENLSMLEKKLDILSERRLALAVEDYVNKSQNHAFGEAMKETLVKQQKKLIERGAGADGGGGGGDEKEASSAKAVREIIEQEASQRHEEEEAKSGSGSKKKKGRGRSASEVDGDDDGGAAKKAKGRKRKASDDDEDDADSFQASRPKKAKGRKRSAPSDDEDDDDDSHGKENGRNKAAAKKRKPAAKSTGRGKKKAKDNETIALESSDEEMAEVQPKKRAPRRAAANKSRVNYTVDESDDEDSGSEAVIDLDDDDEDSLSDVEIVKPKKRAKAAPRSKAKKSQTSRSKRSSYDDDSDDEEELPNSAFGLDSNWGETNTGS